ncbi:MAG: hypothetical protein KF860_10390 [Cyclobacteriaceae bacterium]|nr:hypothetical protein [Cyclobacteriaceae bacterium]
MKLFLFIFFSLTFAVSFSQKQSDLYLLGTWKLKTVLDSSGKKCLKIDKYKLTFNSDSTYIMNFGRSSFILGTWTVVDNKIKFNAQSIADPCFEWEADKQFKSFEINDQGILIIDMFICSTINGRSHFKKMKRSLNNI